MTQTRVQAPELPDSLQWINTNALSLRELKGKVILMHFWTPGCISCMHVLPDLKTLESKYRDQLVVIGIHTPRFQHDLDKLSIEKAINRLHIRHPIAHDPNRRVLNKYGLKVVPSSVLIDAEGYVIGTLRGEGRLRQLDELIGKCVDAAEQKGIYNLDAVNMYRKPEPSSALLFPGKIKATDNNIYISDSGHNRVLEVNYHGRVMRVFGSGAAGLLDGLGREAAFNDPQGLEYINNFLYVADAGNNVVRRINIDTEEVLTIAGNGIAGYPKVRHFHQPTEASLNSPWGLLYQDGILYFAMAGTHQIWKMDMTDNSLEILSGTGQKGMQDGNAEQACLAQPSGLAPGEYCLYFVDAEASALRKVRIPGGAVKTLIGSGLSTAGDLDGGWMQARLQHPQDLCADTANQCLYLADTYNNKIKQVDLNSKGVREINIGSGLNEPGGLSLHGNTLWIANTNAHEIRKINLLNHEVEVLEINEPEQAF